MVSQNMSSCFVLTQRDQKTKRSSSFVLTKFKLKKSPPETAPIARQGCGFDLVDEGCEETTYSRRLLVLLGGALPPSAWVSSDLGFFHRVPLLRSLFSHAWARASARFWRFLVNQNLSRGNQAVREAPLGAIALCQPQGPCG